MIAVNRLNSNQQTIKDSIELSGVGLHSGLNVNIIEPDVSPLQLQGPKSIDIMKVLFGNEITKLKYYWLIETELSGIPLVISRTGWSSELGYEIFFLNSKDGDKLYQTIMESGQHKGLKPGHTSTIRRIEGAMLSYHADMDINTNPFELGLDRFIDIISLYFTNSLIYKFLWFLGINELK